jgi:hypothetical protein
LSLTSFEDYTSKLHNAIRVVLWFIMVGAVTLLWLFLWYNKINPCCSIAGFLIWLGL